MAGLTQEENGRFDVQIVRRWDGGRRSIRLGRRPSWRHVRVDLIDAEVVVDAEADLNKKESRLASDRTLTGFSKTICVTRAVIGVASRGTAQNHQEEVATGHERIHSRHDGL